MDYRSWRAAGVRHVYDCAIQRLVARYRRGRPTLVLLPGGMGSQLDRSLAAHDPRALPPATFETVWADVGLLFNGDALTLEIDGRGRDRERHAVVPHGPLDFLVRAYDGTAQFAADREWNFVPFGYDWRRNMAEAAAWLEKFLLAYQDAVRRKHDEDPLPRTTLLGHSQGGLVAKLFLHWITEPGARLDKVITVGAPFYGTWSHQERYYVGERLLNLLHGARAVARIIGTLPGPYALMFLSREVFARDGERLGLPAYPVVDAATGAEADPYAPVNRKRWPTWVGARHLAAARAVLEDVAAPLPEPARERFYNLRSRLDRNTPTALSWGRIGPGFDPANDPSPISPAATGGGDGMVPDWAAWHAHAAAANRIELAVAHRHADLAEHREVLAVVEGLIEEDRVPAAAERPREDALYGTAPAPALYGEVEDFVRDVRTGRAGRDDPRAGDPAIWRGIWRELKR